MVIYMKLRLTLNGVTTEHVFSAPALLSSLLAQCGAGFCMPCGGRQSCGKCLVEAKGSLLPPDEKEARLLQQSGLLSGWRYACMATATGDVTVTVQKTGESILPVSDSITASAGKWTVCIDLGTTTVAAALYSPDGNLTGAACGANSQQSFGADVITRMEKAMDGAIDLLADAIRGDIDRLTSSLCKQQNINTANIRSAVIVGNTAMLYLLCGKSPDSIAKAPFKADTLFGITVPGSSLKIPALEQSDIYFPRCFSAYVGADISAGMLVCGLFNRPENAPPVLYADIGTNGEASLTYGERLLCCSAPAGPVFEGGIISCGCRAISGAICSMDYSAGKFTYHTIDNAPAVGLCGTGIIEAAAALIKSGLVDTSGNIVAEGHGLEHYVCDYNGQPAFAIPGTDLKITASDIRNIQLAKSAICAGIETLLDKAGLSVSEIESLHIAGGFGTYINPEKADRIGLFPQGLAAKAVAQGNAAAAGAALLSDYASRQLCDLAAERSETVELATSEFFADRFIKNMDFTK